MKGMIMSSIAFLVLVSLFSIAYVFSTNTIQTRSMVSQGLLANRINYIFQAIADSTADIIEKELGDVSQSIVMNVTVDEQPDFNYVTFTEKLPQDEQGIDDFNEDLERYEDFVETYLNETNITIKANIGGSADKITIEPYNTVYDHVSGFGQREVKITPENASELNGYDMIFKLVHANVTKKPTFVQKCQKGNLKWKVTVIGDNLAYSDPIIEYIKPDTNCKLTVGATCNPTALKVTYDGTMLVEVQPGCTIISTISLNLTEIPGETRVDLPDGRINVMETLYKIEKNYTVRI